MLTILDKWSDDIDDIPRLLHKYWKYHNTLTIKDGIILHSKALVIPQSEHHMSLNPFTPDT